MGKKKKNKRLGWKVAHTANSKVELVTEAIVKDFLEKEWARMMGTTEVEFNQKHARKIIKAFKTCEVMLIWREDEGNIPS